jgi:predicted DNA-binding WGR domain protein
MLLARFEQARAPVDYDSAMYIHEKLVREKMAKGYTESSDGTP